MAFQQLYYTSCERGLSGFPGYQFNAATPGVPLDVMREVEKITTYEPPAGLAYASAETRLDAYPVSLCYVPGEPAVLANVAFVGMDFSNRFGNYFAHALLTATPDPDLGELLPIETWQAPFWASTPADSTELPALAGPLGAGPLDRQAVQTVLEEHPGRARLPALLTAAVRAVAAGGPSVVVISDDAEDNACWIAAVSYLLPDVLARRLSFTTYHRRPGYCPLHLVGGLPDPGASSSALEGFTVFDFVEAAGGDAAPHPVAELLARLGPVAADGLWDRAARLGGDLPFELDAWHGPVAAAAAMAGGRLAPVDVNVASAWFVARARELDGGLVDSVAEALLGHATRDEDQLRSIIATTRLAGTGRVEGLDDLEARLVDAELAKVEAGQGSGAEPVIGAPAVRERAARSCEVRLATSSAAGTLALLSWAARAAVPVGDDVVRACGARLGIELMGAGRPGEGRQVVTAWPPLREGLVEWAARSAAANPDVLLRDYGRELDWLIGDRDLSAHPALEEVRSLFAARREPGRRMQALASIASARLRRGQPVGMDDLIRGLWGGGPWTAADAGFAVELLDPSLTASDLVAARISEALLTAPRTDDPADWAEHLLLCRRLASQPARQLLTAPAGDVLGAVLDLDEVVGGASSSATRAGEGVRQLARRFDTMPPAVRPLVLGRLAELLGRASPWALADLMDACPREAVRRYLDGVRPGLDVRAPDHALGAALFAAARRLEGTALGRLLQTYLVETLPRWRRRDQDILLERLERQDLRTAEAFMSWREQQASGSLFGQVGRLFKRPGDGKR
jgi:hypothetical protein